MTPFKTILDKLEAKVKQEIDAARAAINNDETKAAKYVHDLADRIEKHFASIFIDSLPRLFHADIDKVATVETKIIAAVGTVEAEAK